MKTNITLEQVLAMRQPICEKSYNQSKKRWDSIAKPLHSLGKMEDVIMQIAGITGDSNVCLDRKALIVMCADNGVVEEGVTQTGQEVTTIVSNNFLKERATASIMCKMAHADIFPVDIGVASDTEIINKKIAYGTKNMTQGPAMTREQAIQAVETGIHMVYELRDKGYKIIATGEMGIGNTTTSSAIASVLLELPAETVTGKGAGLSLEGMVHKIEVIKKAITINTPDVNDVVDVLSKVGGFDIAGLTGVFLGGMAARIPIVIDGVISAVAALAAIKMNPIAKDTMICSHVSKEPASKIILDAIGMKPCLTCDMCLGEGTGAVTLYPILDMAVAVYQGMSTFTDNSIEEYKPLT